MKIKYILIIVTFIFSCSTLVNAQESAEGSRWKVGFNFGFFGANKYQAAFYNGNPNNVNSLNYVLSNAYWYNEIYNLLDCSDTFQIDDYPTNTKYSPAYHIGFYANTDFKNGFGLTFEFNYSKLHATDVIVFKIDPITYIGNDNLVPYTVYGEETRNSINVGLMKVFDSKHDFIKPYLEIGLNMVNVEVLSNKISIEGKEFDMIDYYGSQGYVPGVTNASDVLQGGIGFGIFATGALKLQFNDNISVDPAFSMYWSRINLENYDQYKPHWAAQIRLIYTLGYVKIGE